MITFNWIDAGMAVACVGIPLMALLAVWAGVEEKPLLLGFCVVVCLMFVGFLGGVANV